MKTNKIFAGLLIGLLTISNVAAEGFPDEPIVIYGDVSGNNIENKNLKISDGENKLLKEVKITGSKYGTNKSLDIINKISLNSYIGTLKFQIDGYNINSITKGNIVSCENNPVFQKGAICDYNLSFTEIIAPVKKRSGGSRGSSSKKTIVTPTPIVTIKTSTGVIENTTVELKENIKIIGKDIKKDKILVKRNKEGKILIKSKDYIKTIISFNKNKKKTTTVFGYKVLNLKGNDSYNKTINTFSKTIYNKISLDTSRKSLFKSLDSVTTTYGIITDENLDENLKPIYIAKLKDDINSFAKKVKKLKRKDEIIKSFKNKGGNNKSSISN